MLQLQLILLFFLPPPLLDEEDGLLRELLLLDTDAGAGLWCWGCAGGGVSPLAVSVLEAVVVDADVPPWRCDA